MDIKNYLDKIVEELVIDITANVITKVDSVISNAINNRLSSYDFSGHIENVARIAFEKKVSEYTIDSKRLENRIVDNINETIKIAKEKTDILVESTIKEKLNNVDFNKVLNDSVSVLLVDKISAFNFPTNSIDPAAINLEKLIISGDNVKSGIIENFSSTGIDDRSTQIALTVLDECTVIENKLLTKDLVVEGSITINGNLIVNGDCQEDSEFIRKLTSLSVTNTLTALDSNFFSRYSQLIFNTIKNDGLDLNKITLNGKDFATADSLGSHIVNSNLKKLGQLNELIVNGESFLSETFYVSKNRVGVNTIEPSSVFAVWDDEVEFVIKKKTKDTAMIGMPRQQKLVLSSNNKDNIILHEDGSTQIDTLQIGTMKFGASDKPPNYISERNHVVWNTNPNFGGPMGWVCLGGANWANFGIIE